MVSVSDFPQLPAEVLMCKYCSKIHPSGVMEAPRRPPAAAPPTLTMFLIIGLLVSTPAPVLCPLQGPSSLGGPCWSVSS